MPFVVFCIFFLALGVPFNIFLTKHGFMYTIFVSSLCSTIAATLKACVNESYAFVVVGQVFTTAGLVFVRSTQPLLARSDWYHQDERVFVLSLAAISLNIGKLAGYLVPTFFLKDSMEDSTFRQALQKLFIGIACVCAMQTVLNLCIFRDKSPEAEMAE